MSPRWLWSVATLVIPSIALACPFCPSAGQTMLGEVKQAHLIVFGSMSNARRDPNEFGKGTTDFEIEVVVKDHEFLKGKKTLTLPRYIPPDPKGKSKHLVFCEIYKGALDPYRGEQVPQDSKIAEYLKGAIDLQSKPVPDRLMYFFQNFDSPDWSISGDAFQEFSAAEYKDVRATAKLMDPDKILKMLKDPNTSMNRYGLLGMLLGHCGKPVPHGQALKTFIDDPKVKQASGLDGLLTGYILLDPKAGLGYVAGLIADSKEEFLVRYAALRCMRFFWEYRSEVVPKEALIGSVMPLIEQADIADLAIEDLRKWERWDLAPKLMGLFEKPTHDVPIVQRSLIKFALSAPATDQSCAELLAKLKADPKQAERVKDLEQLLELEKPRPEKPAAEAAPKK